MKGRSAKHHVILDASDASSLSSFDAAQCIAFQEPKKMSRDCCICHASISSHQTPNSKPHATKSHASSLVLNIPRARLVRTLKTKDSVTLLVKTTKSVHKCLMGIDDWSLTSAMEHSEKWFMHNVNASLIEDFFKGSVEVDCRTGTRVARFKLYVNPDDDGLLTPTMTIGREYSLSLKFVGLQFRKQNFAAVWKLVEATDVDDADDADTKLMISSDDDDEEDDVEPIDEPCPMPQDMVDMINDMKLKIEELHAHHASLIERLSDLRDRLCGTPSVHDVNDAADALAEICT